MAEEEIERSPLERVVVAKANSPAPDVLTDEELKLLLKACAGSDFYARRDLALIRFMLATGLRVSETVELPVGDLELNNRLALVRHGKGDKARAVRFDAATAAALDRYKRIRARHPYASLPWLWIGYRGRMTRKGVPTSSTSARRRPASAMSTRISFGTRGPIAGFAPVGMKETSSAWADGNRRRSCVATVRREPSTEPWPRTTTCTASPDVACSVYPAIGARRLLLGTNRHCHLES